MATSSTRSSAAGVDRADHGAPPARILTEAERRREQVVAGGRPANSVSAPRFRSEPAATSRWSMAANQASPAKRPTQVREWPLRACRRRNSLNEERRWRPRSRRRQGDGAVATAGEDTLSITDNRTGETYELEVTDGTIRAMDLRQIKVSEDDFGLMAYDPAFTNTASCRSAITYIDGEAGILQHRGYPDRAALRAVDATSRSPTCWSSASCPPSRSWSAGPSTSPTTRSSTRTSRTSSRPSATTPTRWGCCSPGSARCRPSIRRPSTSTTPRSATWRRSG